MQPEPGQSNPISSLRHLFPECDIKIVFNGKEDVEAYPIAVSLKRHKDDPANIKILRCAPANRVLEPYFIFCPMIA